MSNIRAEQIVLASVLHDPYNFRKIEQLKPDDFSQEPHSLIYKAMQTIAEEGNLVDVIILAETLKQSGNLEAAGGYGYILDLGFAGSADINLELEIRRILKKHLTLI